MSTVSVLREVRNERRRQDEKHGPIQDIPDGTGEGKYLPSWGVASPQQPFPVWRDYLRGVTDRSTVVGIVRWSDVLLEEVFEAMSESDPGALRAELVQVAAVAVKWIEHLDRKGNP